MNYAQGLAPFEGPRAKITRARHHLVELSSLLGEYLDGMGGAYIQLSETVWSLRLSKDRMPPMVPLALGDLMHNLRSALDLALCHIAERRNKSLENMRFPFAADENSFLHPRSKELPAYFRLGDDVVAEIRKLKPWKVVNGGNRIVRGVHDLDIQDKHRLVLPVTSFVSVSGDIAPFAIDAINELIKKENPGRPLMDAGSFISMGGPLIAISPGEELEMPHGIHPNQTYPLTSGSLRVVFPANSALAGEAVIEASNECVQVFSEIVESLAAQFG